MFTHQFYLAWELKEWQSGLKSESSLQMKGWINSDASRNLNLCDTILWKWNWQRGHWVSGWARAFGLRQARTGNNSVLVNLQAYGGLHYRGLLYVTDRQTLYITVNWNSSQIIENVMFDDWFTQSEVQKQSWQFASEPICLVKESNSDKVRGVPYPYQRYI